MSALCRLHIPKERLRCDLSLYLVANRPSFQDEELFFLKVMQSVQGGVSCVQLRDHQSDFASVVRTALRLKEMLDKVPLFINTLKPLVVAEATDAAGVYLEEGISYSQARKRLGQKSIIGIPVKTLEEVRVIGQSNAVDYLSVKVSASQFTCPRNDALWEIEGLRSVCSLSPHRLVGIGGLNLVSAEAVYRILREGDGIAMAGGLMREKDPLTVAKGLQAMRQNMRRGL